MVDNISPNSQFHPYQPMNDIPAVERPMKGKLERFRQYARAKPGVVLGGLAALSIGAGLWWRRVFTVSGTSSPP